VPSYSADPVHAYPIYERMKQTWTLREIRERTFPRIVTANKIPTELASSDQRCRAAIRAVRKLTAVKSRDK
jgi:hypothetical protein